MAADRLPAEVGEFATYLNGLLARLDPSGGWCAVFWHRDPEGMRACLDGREMPPWDVVEALLQDLAGRYGPGNAGPEQGRARSLHAAALAAYDTRPGGRHALGDRLDVMLREQRHAAERRAALARQLTSATTRSQADALRLDLAWAQDDHERAAARCAELRARIAQADRREQGPPPGTRSDADAPHGAGAGSPALAQQHRTTPAWTPTTTPGRYGAVTPETGRHAQGRPGAGSGSGEAVEGVRPEGFAGPGGAGAGGPHAPGRPDPRSGSGEAGEGVTPDPFAGPGGAGVDGWRALRRPGARSGSGVAVGGGRPEEFAGPGRTGAGGRVPQGAEPRSARAEAVAGGSPDAFPAAALPDAFTAPAPAAPTSKQRKRRRGSARFAGMADEGTAPVTVPPAVVPVLPEPAPAATGRTPRGARFAGAAEEAGGERPVREADPAGAADLAEVERTVDALARLRSEGRSGEAHALLAEVASWEPGRFPLLAQGLHAAGLGADWQTLLWEAASLPAGRLVAVADALVAAGRPGDGRQMLRQGVARPPGELGQAVLDLVAEERHREVRVLLDAFVGARTPEEAARSAEPGPGCLVPLLLEAARGVSQERHRDVVHALRVAGLPA
ncbi:hypothetical protein QNO09_17560 [Streptomyces sp. 378]|uniref:hypothetical protein n=1 Tax=Streptomyces sp. 378 TaxID=3049412 RepID=UPI0024C34EF5|nr:hypothetical protein [Streptomyces sp. 378]MDK1345077.1 hypothetical protein [Streptomyces sp. 378]